MELARGAQGDMPETADDLKHASLEDRGDPLALFDQWLAEAGRFEINDPNAMSLATATPDGVPSVRIVLLKQRDERGFSFFTNGESRKGGELRANQHAALCFHWKSLQRQVRIEGTITEVPPEEVDAYFRRRHRMSQIGAWASQQSRPLSSREELIALTTGVREEVSRRGSPAAVLDRVCGEVRSALNSGRSATSGCTTASFLREPVRLTGRGNDSFHESFDTSPFFSAR